MESPLGFVDNIGLVARKPECAACEQHRRNSACAFAQSNRHLCCSLSGMYNIPTSTMQSFNILTVAEHVGLNLTLSEISKTGFLALRSTWLLLYF